MDDFLFRGTLEKLDPEIYELTQLEAERQYRKLILIPSESASPLAVREALGSAFHNIYAEGYPDEEMRWMDEAALLDYPPRLSHFRRYSDPRYYKGVEYADIVESLARRRCAELFAANGYTADHLFVNVQPLSGAPANNAVYHALLEPGDTLMGMDLIHGGHLTHGSAFNRSGKLYNVVHYTVDPETERLDYDQLKALALETRPRLIIAGYSSYPWSVDWGRFRAIADAVGAYLLADIAHVAGLVAGRAYPSPVGYADVVSFTTHKTLCGPRGACILTLDPALARRLDRAVFPGEQGGPHVNVFAAMALSFKLATTQAFRDLQRQIVNNCVTFTARLQNHGLRIPYGGTDTHLMNLDCHSVTGQDGAPLSGDQAARILDLAGIVVNRNTIPGDHSAANPAGIRMGTTWVTQRGFDDSKMDSLADIIADLLKAITPHYLPSRKGVVERAKVSFDALETAKLEVRNLAEASGIDYEPSRHGYPHFYYLDDAAGQHVKDVAFDIGGDDVRQFLNFALTSDVEGLLPGESQPTRLITNQAGVDGTLICLSPQAYQLVVPAKDAALAANWLRALSDGFIEFDTDLERKLPGPIWIRRSGAETEPSVQGKRVDPRKPYYAGIAEGVPDDLEPLQDFHWYDAEGDLRQTALNETHRGMGARMVPFAGWDMPVWYTSVIDEHLAVRQSAGLFDVSHMGVYQAEGPDAYIFLDSVCGNDIRSLGVGQSLYTHFLDPHANVIDDLLVYRRGPEKYLVVVNASNDDKNWAWLNGVRQGQVCVDQRRPWARAYGRNVTLRNLRDPGEGSEMRVDLALQGPRAREALLALGCDDDTRQRILRLKRTELTEGTLGGFDLVISRTGYTGEKMAFELFVHPDQSVALWNALLGAGQPLGLKPCGLGARDSLRTEAGLPLYGHEMGGELNLGISEAGFGYYVKTYKPWFIGRDAFMMRDRDRTGEVARFRFDEKGVRMAHLGDPVVDRRGKVIGTVTSCAVDTDGYLTGQAYLDLKFIQPGTAIHIFQGAERAESQTPAGLKPGERITIPGAATVVSRFPK